MNTNTKFQEYAKELTGNFRDIANSGGYNINAEFKGLHLAIKALNEVVSPTQFKTSEIFEELTSRFERGFLDKFTGDSVYKGIIQSEKLQVLLTNLGKTTRALESQINLTAKLEADDLALGTKTLADSYYWKSEYKSPVLEGALRKLLPKLTRGTLVVGDPMSRIERTIKASTPYKSNHKFEQLNTDPPHEPINIDFNDNEKFKRNTEAALELAFHHSAVEKVSDQFKQEFEFLGNRDPVMLQSRLAAAQYHQYSLDYLKTVHSHQGDWMSRVVQAEGILANGSVSDVVIRDPLLKGALFDKSGSEDYVKHLKQLEFGLIDQMKLHLECEIDKLFFRREYSPIDYLYLLEVHRQKYGDLGLNQPEANPIVHYPHQLGTLVSDRLGLMLNKHAKENGYLLYSVEDTSKFIKDVMIPAWKEMNEMLTSKPFRSHLLAIFKELHEQIPRDKVNRSHELISVQKKMTSAADKYLGGALEKKFKEVESKLVNYIQAIKDKTETLDQTVSKGKTR